MFWEGDTFAGALPFALLLVRLFSWLPAYRLVMVGADDRTGSLPVVMLMHASLVATQVVLLPATLSEASTVICTLAWAALLWVLVATAVVADSGQFARRPLQRRVA